MPKYDPCSTGMPCAAGEMCVNGLCASGCNSQADCMPGEYCDLMNGQLCLPATQAACPATPCAPTQVCVEGLCGTIPTGNACGASPFGGDGCTNTELCLNDIQVNGMLTTMPTCYVLPPCSKDHPCSPGGMGALCSTGFIPGKNLCIPGACATATDCPTGWQCVPGVGMTGYGSCTNGTKGSPCGKTSDCNAGLMCYTPIMSMLGTCK